MRKLLFGVSVAVMAMGFLAQTAATVVAQDNYPSKQINWYIHSSAGGGTDIFTLINQFTGGAFQRLSVFAMGVMPYITASIVFQLLTPTRSG